MDGENDQNGWDKFVTKASKFIDSGDLVKKEVQYKLEIAYKVAAAREAVLFGTDNWADSLKEALEPQQPITYWALINLIQWCQKDPVKSLKAMQAIWTKDSLSDTSGVTDRV